MADTVISVENLSKVYRLGRAAERHESLIGAARSLATAPLRKFRDLRGLDAARAATSKGESPDLLWALRDVSFEVRRGEVLGIIGRNGAGKSTLLKILSRVAEPTRGRIRMRGRLAALLEVGTGFHPELTGRENVYLNGTILGMRRPEIDRKFDEIVDFAGVERFLDTPVKRYSSGMKVRLGFAVAAHLEPEILIVDEVLAVGDYEFQRKCLGKLEEVAHGGGQRTILFVSHNMGMMRSLCNRCLCLQHGRLAFEGTAEDCIEFYEQSAGRPDADGSFRAEDDPELPWQILEAELLDGDGRRATVIDQFEPLSLRFVYRVSTPLVGHNLSLGLTYRGDRLFTSFDTDEQAERLERREPGLYEVAVPLPTESLKAGSYGVSLSTGAINRTDVAARQVLTNFLRFEVREAASGSLKSYAPARIGAIVARLPWRQRQLQEEVAR